ncbi:MAG: helix-hairpin-helix domain-containing protein [Bacteroidales bacterium]|nr:helix-hairpin-helix domain-containing protein [Bacteroidales bacterium]
MWKEYFSHTKGERQAAIVLFILIILASSALIYLSNNEPIVIDKKALDQFQKEVKEFESSQKKISKNHSIFTKYPKYQPIVTSLFPFDPNKADSITFLRLGLKPFMAKAILNYRKKGGRYRKPSDFSKVPYINKNLLNSLLPYIRIDESLFAKRDTFPQKNIPYQKQEKYAEGIILDLATADTTELKKIPGIASGTALSIINYRTRLGGYYSVEQLRELKTINEEQFQKISKFLQIKTLTFSRISVNKSGLDRLRSHPYLNFYQAKAIVELRKKKGAISNMEELLLFEEFTEKDFARLKYYLDFTSK